MRPSAKDIFDLVEQAPLFLFVRRRLEILRRAFKATLTDPEFQAQAAKSKLDITYVSGEEAERIVGEVLAIAPKVRENLQFLSQAK